MYRTTMKTLLAAAILAMLTACAAIEKLLPLREDPSVEGRRATVAMASLEHLGEIDAYIKLGNDYLRKQVHSALIDQAAGHGAYRFSRLRVRVSKQVIALSGTLEITSEAGHTVTANVIGDVVLTYSGNQLIWLPQFNELQVTSTDFFFEDAVYAEASEVLNRDLLQRVNRDIADPLIVLGHNTVNIDALPLGHVEVGVSLTRLDGISAGKTHELGGVFTVAASAIMIEPAQTSIALDLAFIPNISTCRTDVRVSRSAFAREITEREPVGIIRYLENGPVDGHFYTEVKGAAEPTEVVHYWFADGRPVALEALPVDASPRWRTWSSHAINPHEASNWEVIVVEKDSGCILHSQAIGTGFSSGSSVSEPTARDPASFAGFKAAFEERLAGFSILGRRPDVALIEVSRPFLASTLDDSLKDLQIVVTLDVGEQPAQSLTGFIRPFDAGEITCEERTCAASRECRHGYSRCTRLRDNRDCTTCLFRNPLNNRCITEGTDPICEAARTAQNAKYDAAREACVEQETVAAAECGKLVAQELRSCEIEAASEQTICEGAREAITAFSGADSFAAIDLQLQSHGRLNAIFSDMRIEGDLERFRLNLGFGASLKLEGDLRFSPVPALGPLADCMSAWEKSFNASVVLPQLASSMIGEITAAAPALVTRWSGYVAPAKINPSPIAAMFAGNPNLLADCHIGLTTAKVIDAIGGNGRDYLAGTYPTEIQPSPTRVVLGKARVEYGELHFMADPQLGPTHLRYEVMRP